MMYREWKDHLKSGNLQSVKRFLSSGFDINSEIGIVIFYTKVNGVASGHTSDPLNLLQVKRVGGIPTE